MDNRNEIRDFLISRRARITPDQAGLPAYGGNRRVAGLRREEVAMLAGISVDYYTRLERGNATGASASVLEALAGALQLDEAERAHLFDLVRAASAGGTARAPCRPTGPQVRLSVQRILDSMITTRPTSGTDGWTSSPRTGSAGRFTYRCSTAPPSPPTPPGSSSSTRARRSSTSNGNARPRTSLRCCDPRIVARSCLVWAAGNGGRWPGPAPSPPGCGRVSPRSLVRL
jgi:hypothetical protein